MAHRSSPHVDNIRNEILSYIEESLSQSGTEDLLDTIEIKNNQTKIVYTGMCSVGEDDEFHPNNVDPQTVEHDYYRESISEYGSVYTELCGMTVISQTKKKRVTLVTT